VEYWHVRRYESIIRVEKSSVDPRSVVDRGAARTNGVRSPRRMGKGSVAVPMLCAAGGGCGTVRNGASGCPTNWRGPQVAHAPGGPARAHACKWGVGKRSRTC
jgi:hypothetical protein